MSPSSKIWVRLQMSHTQILPLHLEPPLLKFLEITPVVELEAGAREKEMKKVCDHQKRSKEIVVIGQVGQVQKGALCQNT